MTKALLVGAAGKMGQTIYSLQRYYDDFEIVYGIDNSDRFIKIEDADPEKVDIVIDISSQKGFNQGLKWALKNRKPFVSGTTGLEKDDYDLLESASRSIAVLHTSNLSRGVNILFDIVKKAAQLTIDADIEIIETHHNKKKDAPSGTALEIGKIITGEQISKKLKPVHGRSGITGERNFEEIGYHSLRCGDVPGEHTVIFAFEGERIEISHRALTRDIFARGAIKAAIFLSQKTTGQYSMKDMISN
jgi:4-hydroxy-tetrahydrodipicolinate reductase